jgi:hypothetical protein
LGDGTTLYGGQTALRLTRRAVLLSAALPLAGCFDGESVSRRIKLIATAEVDGKQVQGSTVMELTWRASGSRMYQSQKGEALILELAGRGTVYVLATAHYKTGDISDGILTGIVNRVAGTKWQTANRKELSLIRDAAGRHKILPYGAQFGAEPAELLMVAFKDETRKATVFEVKKEDFSKHFGNGVKFIGLEFEFTNEPITDALKKRLPMIGSKTPGNDFPRDPDGQGRADSEVPFPYKMSSNMFFSFGEI